MAVVFEGEVKIMINRHGYLGDGISLRFPEFIIFLNTSNKYTLQFTKDGETSFLKSDCESVADAYIHAQVRLGNLELKDGMYVPVNA